MRCLQVECWAETKLVKRSKWLEPRERREGGEDVTIRRLETKWGTMHGGQGTRGKGRDSCQA